MSEVVDMETLEAFLKKAEDLRRILKESPEVITFLQLVKETRREMPVLPKQADRLVEIKEAAFIRRIVKLSATFLNNRLHKVFGIQDIFSVAD